MKKTFFILATLTFILLPFTTARGEVPGDFFLKDDYSLEKKRRTVSPDLPPFKNPMFNGDFDGRNVRGHNRLLELYPDGPFYPKSSHSFAGECTMIVNEPDRVVYKCLKAGKWYTYHYLNASDPFLHEDGPDEYCHIVEQKCMEEYCRNYSYVFCRLAEGNECGPVAPYEEWFKPVIDQNRYAYEDDYCGHVFKRDLELRKKFGIPSNPSCP